MAPNSSETGIVNKPDKEQNSAIQIFMELAGAMGTRQLICAAQKYIFTFFTVFLKMWFVIFKFMYIRFYLCFCHICKPYQDTLLITSIFAALFSVFSSLVNGG